MVSLRRDRRGASTMGCLLSLLVLVAVLYYGVNIGEVYFRYYRLLDEMQGQARVAAALDNGTIQRRIASAIQEIGLPDDASSNLQITRSASPRSSAQAAIESCSTARPAPARPKQAAPAALGAILASANAASIARAIFA